MKIAASLRSVSTLNVLLELLRIIKQTLLVSAQCEGKHFEMKEEYYFVLPTIYLHLLHGSCCIGTAVKCPVMHFFTEHDTSTMSIYPASAECA
jgi:hypothetical protein